MNTMFGSSLSPVVCWPYLRYLCLLAYSGVQHILCLCFLFVFLPFVYPMLPVSLDCPFFDCPFGIL